MMWIRTDLFETLVRARADADTRAAEATRQLAVMQQNFDWLANHVNRLERERQTLLARLLDVGLVAPQIGRTSTGPARPGAIVGAPIPEEDRPATDEIGMALAGVQASSFEDMGDVAAGLYGVAHDPTTGMVTYTK